MNFLWLKYFTTVAEEGSVRNAAKKLYVSEQAVGQIVRKLESELGVELLSNDRNRSVTEAGQCVYQYADQILRLQSDMLCDISENYAERSANTIRIGTALGKIPPYYEKLQNYIKRRRPELIMELIPQSSSRTENFRGADLYFPQVPLTDYLENVILFEDYICAVVGDGLLQEVYGSRAAQKSEQLRREGELSLIADLPFAEPILSDGSFTERLLGTERKKQLKITFWGESADACLQLCAADQAALIIPGVTAHKQLENFSPELRKRVGIYPLNVNNDAMKVAVSYKKGKKLSPLERDFIALAQDFFREDLEQG